MLSTSEKVFVLTTGGLLYWTDNLGSTWNSVGTGQLSYVQAFHASDSGTILAATASGLMLSSDEGLTWGEVGGATFEGFSIQDVHINSQGRFIVSVYQTKIFYSSDNGLSWSQGAIEVWSTPDDLDSSPDGTLYVGTYWQGVYKSTDGGESWYSAATGLPSGGVSQVLPVTDSKIFALAQDQSQTYGLFVSNDRGMTWQSAGPNLPSSQNRATRFVTTNGHKVWAAQDLFGVGSTIDDGQTWTGLSEVIPQNVVAMAPTSIGELYVGCNSQPYSVGPNPDALGVLKSSDRGGHWTAKNDGFDNFDLAVQSMVRADDDTIVVLPYTPGDILTKSWLDSSWARLKTGVWSTFSSAFKAADGTLIIGNYWDGPWKSTNNGYSWSRLPDWPENTSSAMGAKDSQGNYYVVRQGQAGNFGLYRYAPSEGWSYLAFDGKKITALLVTGDDNILVGTETDLFISENGGENWLTFTGGLPDGTGVYALLESCDGTLYLASRGGSHGVYKYPVGAGVWQTMQFPINSFVSRIYSLAFMKGNLFAGTNNGVFYTETNACMEDPQKILKRPLGVLFLLQDLD